MFAWQTRDLYHIETDRKGGYIEFARGQIYRAEPSEAYLQIAFVSTIVVLEKKRGRGAFTLFVLFLSVGNKVKNCL